MLKISDQSQTSNPFESLTSNTSNGLADLFKSIFDSKIDNKIDKNGKNTFQLDNKKNDNLIAAQAISKKESSIESYPKRSELLRKAEIAKKTPDKDIIKAHGLLNTINYALEDRGSVEPKKYRISKDQLMGAIKGLRKLNSVNKTNNIEKEPDFDPSKEITLQFDDAKITFTPTKNDGQNAEETYDFEVVALSKSTSDGTPAIASQKTLPDQILDSGAKLSNEQVFQNLQNKDSTSDNQNLSMQNEENQKLKEQIVKMVGDKSPEAADAMTKDQSLQIKIESLPKNIKVDYTDKVVAANQASATFFSLNEDVSTDGVDKIAPSANLKDLINTQNGVLQINIDLSSVSEIEIILPLEEQGNSKKEGATALPVNAIMTKDSMELHPESSLMANGSKMPQNAPSSSVLERINQVAMVQKISKRIQLRQLKEFGVVNIQLDPPELGKLLVKLTIKDKDIKVSIIAECESANEMLKNHKHIFIKSLRENGLDISEFDVSTKDNSNQSSFSQMNENKDRLAAGAALTKNDVFNKEINNDVLYNQGFSENLIDGHHISLIA